MNNTALYYTYRCGANYKQSSCVIFAGRISDADSSTFREQRFIASQVGLKDLQEDLIPMNRQYDHAWSELDDLRLTDAEPTDPRTIEQFVQEFSAAEWDEEPVKKKLGLITLTASEAEELASTFLGSAVLSEVMMNESKQVELLGQLKDKFLALANG